MSPAGSLARRDRGLGIGKSGKPIEYSPHSLLSSDLSGQSAFESHRQRIGMQNPSLHVKYEAGQGPEIG